MSLVALFLLSLILILPLQHYECKPPEDTLNPEEKQALITFNKTVRHSTKNFNWNPSEPACSWKGVTCDPDNKTVFYLRLPGKSFVGTIPPNTIGKLTSLRVLSLRVNGFFGELPPDLSNLNSLTRLALNNNSFSGTIPDFFSYFTGLVRFTLNNNSFSGQLPYIDSEKLTVFDVSLNKLNGSIPPSLSKFPIDNFTHNVFLCGKPTKNTCNETYQIPGPPNREKREKKTPEILGISIGSGLLLLVLLCCVRKKVYDHHQQAKQAPEKVWKGDKLVLFDENRIRSLGIEDLLDSSAVVLGEGSVGVSYKQVLEGANTTVVVKRLRNVVVTENEFKNKMERLGKMKNNNLAPLLAYYCSKYEKLLVYDYMPAGSLSARLHASGGTQLDWDRRMRIALSAARGLAYLHEDKESVVHGNINSSNILLRQESTNEAFVSDYGLNMLFDASSSQDHHAMSYWAPEVHNTREVTLKSDVYSFGVLLLELLTGKNPMQASLGKEGVLFSKLLESIACDEANDEIFDVELRMDDHNVEEMRKLLKIAKDCVSSVQDQRPTMQDVVSNMVWLRQSSDDHSKGYDYTPSTETHDTPSTITQDTPSTITP